MLVQFRGIKALSQYELRMPTGVQPVRNPGNQATGQHGASEWTMQPLTASDKKWVLPSFYVYLSPGYSFKELPSLSVMAFRDKPRSVYQGNQGYRDRRLNAFF